MQASQHLAVDLQIMEGTSLSKSHARKSIGHRDDMDGLDLLNFGCRQPKWKASPAVNWSTADFWK